MINFDLESEDEEKKEELAVAPRYFNIEEVKKAFLPFKQNVDEMLKVAQALEIVDDETQARAITIAGEARRLSKAVDGTKLSETREYREFTSQVNGLAAMFVKPLEEIVKVVKKKSDDYSYKKLIEQRRREEEEREKQRKLQRELDAQAKAANVETVVLPEVPVLRETKEVARTESGSSLSTRFVWKGRIVNPEIVPREYCQPVQRMIDDAVKAGVRVIEGVVIEEVPDSRLRA